MSCFKFENETVRIPVNRFIVEGGYSLKGEITPAGNKNEALPVIAATLLTEEPVILRNLPEIADIRDMRKLVEGLGVKVTNLGANIWQFEASALDGDALNKEVARRIRGSFLLAGPLLGRLGKAELPVPGGDKIGVRPVSVHLEAFQEMGVQVQMQARRNYVMKCPKMQGTYLHLSEASVMATENIIMAAVLAKGATVIYNAACEPHVQGLCNLLVQMGAQISGIGSNCLTIQGVESLHGADYRIQADHTEVGSFIGLAAVTRSEIWIRQAAVEHLRMIRATFLKLGVETIVQENDLLVPKDQYLRVQGEPNQGIPKIDDAPWPGFPADLTSIITVVATQCEGTVLVHEKMFESRLFWIDRLISMGARIILCDPHRAVINGASPLTATTLFSPDIRAGMSLLIAAMCADGISEIHNIQQIDRGYEAIDTRLNQLGASIQRVGAE